MVDAIQRLHLKGIGSHDLKSIKCLISLSGDNLNSASVKVQVLSPPFFAANVTMDKQNKNSSIMKFKVFDIDTGKWSDPFVLEDVITGEAEIEWDGGESTLPWKDFMFFRKEYGELTPIGQKDFTEWLDESESPSGETLEAVEFADFLVGHFDCEEFDNSPKWSGIMNGITKDNWTTQELYNLFLQQTGKPSVDTQQAKENRDLKEEIRKLRNQIAMIESDYWKQRCEAAEAVIEAISEPPIGNHLVRMGKWKDLKSQQHE